jgi:hypothetical protein
MYSADTATNNDLNATQAAWVLAILHNCLAEDKAEGATRPFHAGTYANKFKELQEFCNISLQYPYEHPGLSTAYNELTIFDAKSPEADMGGQVMGT